MGIGALHGELSDDGSTIILRSAGASAWTHKRIATLVSKLTATLKETGTGAMTVPCTWANVVQIGWTFRQLPDLAWVPGDRLRYWMAQQAAIRYGPLPELERSWPEGMSPRDYQVEAARQLARAGKFLLLDEMGLGKCCETILGIEQRRRMGITVFPLLIIVPGRVVADAWEREIAAWAPHWPQPQMYLDPPRFTLLGSRDRVLLTTYATAAIDAPAADGPLARYRPAAVVLDEGQAVQNADAVRTKAAERICKHAGTVVILSGTLFTQDTGGSFAPLKCLDEGTWQDKQRYKDRFLLTRKTEFAEKITGLNPVTEPEFRACLDGQMIRRTKAQVLPELPPKVYTVLRPEIPPEWRAAYDQLRDDMLASLPDGGELPVFDTLTQLTRLSQLASCAADVEWIEEWDERLEMFVKKPKVSLRYPSWKAEVLMEIMAKRTSPVAVFTASRQLAEITGRDYLEKAGYRTGYILGIGKGITQGSRKRDIAAFQAGELDAIVCTAKAGGVGITLTAADTVVFLQRDYEFDKSIQPEDRAHRFGQLANKVQIVDVVAKGTVDERARELIHEKGARWAEFCRDPEFVKSLLGGNRL